ncbi:MAG: HNH endonuclease, partial [Thermodesulfobacteriota bacterium]
MPSHAGIPQARIDVQSPDDSADSIAPRVIPEKAGIPRPRIDVQPYCDSAESCRCEDFAQRRVDALGLLAEAALGQGLGKMERSEPYQVMVHVDANVLADQSFEGRSELGNGEGISAESCQRLACDAPHVTVGQDVEGNVLHMGRKTRRISKYLWRALIGRDRACKFPGCGRTRHLQAHHIQHWAKGGETTPDNLVLLCRAHHWAVHEGGVRVERRASLGHVFHRPDDTPLPVSLPLVPIRGEAGETLKEVNRRHGLEITS